MLQPEPVTRSYRLGLETPLLSNVSDLVKAGDAARRIGDYPLDFTHGAITYASWRSVDAVCGHTGSRWGLQGLTNEQIEVFHAAGLGYTLKRLTKPKADSNYAAGERLVVHGLLL